MPTLRIILTDQESNPLCYAHSRGCDVELTVAEDWIRQVDAHFAKRLSLRFVDRQDVSQAQRKLTPSQLEGQLRFARFESLSDPRDVDGLTTRPTTQNPHGDDSSGSGNDHGARTVAQTALLVQVARDHDDGPRSQTQLVRWRARRVHGS